MFLNIHTHIFSTWILDLYSTYIMNYKNIEDTYILNSIIFLMKAPSDDGGSPVTQYKVEMRDVDRRAWNDVGELNIASGWEDNYFSTLLRILTSE